LCPFPPSNCFQEIANWGARRGGATGAVALNVGAGLAALGEVAGLGDAEAAVGAAREGRWASALGAAFFALPGAKGGKAVRGLGNIGGGSATVEQVLRGAERWLGEGYREIAPGVFRSANNARQFRMKSVEDLSDAVPHVHFESIAPNGRTIVENAHVILRNQ